MPFLDWARGIAAAIMLQGHTFHSFSRNDLRQDGPYILSQFMGGIAPAIFLFLTGITFAFSMERSDRQGLSRGQKLISALHRSRYLLLLAVLFRLQLWLFSQPYGSWQALFKVDILNCMALTMFVLSVTAMARLDQRARWCLFIGLGIAAASPLVSAANWDWLHPFVRSYFVPSYDFFSFFPWASFLAFGLSVGSILKMVKQAQMHRVMLWTTVVGFALITGGQYFSNLPYSLYTKSEFWLNSPGLIAVKFGVVLLLLAFAFLWTEHLPGHHWSWIRQLGANSLIVYWVHIELVYGRWFGFWKEGLTAVQCAIFSALLIVLMLGLTWIKGNWSKLKIASLWPSFAGTAPPRRVSAD